MHKSTSLLYATSLFSLLLLVGCTDSPSNVDDTSIPEVKNIEDPTDSLNLAYF